jgi:hypothetical protein
MLAIKYKAKYDEPKAQKKPARKEKSMRKSRGKKTTTANTKRVTRPKKRLPRMKKIWWPFW